MLKIRERDRQQWSNQRDGLRPEWTEYQVVRGRKIVARFERKEAAERYVAEHNS